MKFLLLMAYAIDSGRRIWTLTPMKTMSGSKSLSQPKTAMTTQTASHSEMGLPSGFA